MAGRAAGGNGLAERLERFTPHSLIALAAVAGYWIDRRLFPYARPDMFLSVDEPPEIEEDAPEGGTLSLGTVADPVLARLMAAAMLRRAIIVAAAMIAVGLGA